MPCGPSFGLSLSARSGKKIDIMAKRDFFWPKFPTPKTTGSRFCNSLRGSTYIDVCNSVYCIYYPNIQLARLDSILKLDPSPLMEFHSLSTFSFSEDNTIGCSQTCCNYIYFNMITFCCVIYSNLFFKNSLHAIIT